MTTESEYIFEIYCLNKRINFAKIEESSIKTPDYLINIDGYKFLAEITQLNLNDAEKDLYKSLIPNKFIVYYPEDEKRIRQKIKDKSGQLKTHGSLPIILIFYDNRSIFSTLNFDSIKYALYGSDDYNYYYDEGKSRFNFLQQVFGKDKTLTKENKNYISAIGFLKIISGNNDLFIYHNPFAVIPLNKKICEKIFTKQYEIILDFNQQSDWVEINS